MARFYFDTSDGEAGFDDHEGVEMSDREAACRVVLATLPEMMRDKVLARAQAADAPANDAPDERPLTVCARVRDAGGTVVYTATLTLVGSRE